MRIELFFKLIELGFISYKYLYPLLSFIILSVINSVIFKIYLSLSGALKLVNSIIFVPQFPISSL